MKIFKSEQSKGAMSADFSVLRSEETLKRRREEQRWGPANVFRKSLREKLLVSRPERTIP